MNRPHEYIFGPVPSRRLGRSLGIDVIPRKICTLDCLYCEVGPTTRRLVERFDYIPPERILRELQEVLPGQTGIDWITFTGSGEPTLNASLGGLIRAAKMLSQIPVAVITNGTLLYRSDVQEDLLAADAVLPSLDAATPAVFRKINRPAPGIGPPELIDGLVSFRHRYKGHIWLEILFAEGYNDTDTELEALREAVERIAPDKLQLNTVVRPPAYPVARPLSGRRLAELATFFGPRCEVVCTPPDEKAASRHRSPQELLAIVSRRPMTAPELAEALGCAAEEIDEALGALLLEHRLNEVVHDGRTFYETPRDAL